MSTPEPPTLGKLGHQSLRRPLTEAENCLARALEAIFATGCHEFTAVAVALQEQQIPRPSGATGPWTLEVLEVELRLINESLDEAYLRGSAAAGA